MAVTAKFTKRFGINISAKMSEEVERLADVQGVSYAEIIRQALEVGLPNVRGYDESESPSVRD